VSPSLWLLVHLVSVAVLTGVAWTVQLVVYPAFALVGDPEWTGYHRRHRLVMNAVVLLPWTAQGVSTVALLVAPAAGGLPGAVTLGVLGLVTVVLTVAAAVPEHDRLTAGDRTRLRPLLRANLLRTLAWTTSTGVAAALLA
jgi:hypothetical protein